MKSTSKISGRKYRMFSFALTGLVVFCFSASLPTSAQTTYTVPTLGRWGAHSAWPLPSGWRSHSQRRYSHTCNPLEPGHNNGPRLSAWGPE